MTDNWEFLYNTKYICLRSRVNWSKYLKNKFEKSTVGDIEQNMSAVKNFNLKLHVLKLYGNVHLCIRSTHCKNINIIAADFNCGVSCLMTAIS